MRTDPLPTMFYHATRSAYRTDEADIFDWKAWLLITTSQA